jgi:hypothetical protein
MPREPLLAAELRWTTPALARVDAKPTARHRPSTRPGTQTRKVRHVKFSAEDQRAEHVGPGGARREVWVFGAERSEAEPRRSRGTLLLEAAARAQ